MCLCVFAVVHACAVCYVCVNGLYVMQDNVHYGMCFNFKLQLDSLAPRYFKSALRCVDRSRVAGVRRAVPAEGDQAREGEAPAGRQDP